jgi:hypothetical protein
VPGTHFPLPPPEQLYAALCIPLPESSLTAMLAYLRDKPKGKFGRHEHSLAETGLDPAALQERFAFYTDHYGISLEGGASA